MTRISSFAAQTLQRLILEGVFPRGEALPGQRELAVRLGISRTALREAISTLEALGMVHAQPGKGVFVTAGRARLPEEIPNGPLEQTPQDVFQFRAIVEPAAAALAAMDASPAVRASLHAIEQKMEEALRALDLVGASDADLAFHLAIADYAGNPLLARSIRSLEDSIAYSLRLPFADPAGIWAPVDEHRAVLAAIDVANVQAAQGAMRSHLVKAAERIGTRLPELPVVIL